MGPFIDLRPNEQQSVQRFWSQYRPMIHSYIQAVNEDFFSGRGEVTETPYSAIDVATPMFLLDCNLGGEYGDPHVKMATFVQCSSRGCELHIYARNSGFTEDKNEVAVDMNAASIEAAFRNVITWLLDQGLVRCCRGYHQRLLQKSKLLIFFLKSTLCVWYKVLFFIVLSGNNGSNQKTLIHDKLIEHKRYIDSNGKDLPEILNGRWKN